jgi:hypothetical protein
MEIRKLQSIPKMEKQESGDYHYSDDYTGKIFEIGDDFVLFYKNTYNQFPKMLIHTIVDLVQEQIQVPEEKEMDFSFLENIESEILKLKTTISTLKNEKQNINIESTVTELINASLSNFSKEIVNYINTKTAVIEKPTKLEPMKLLLLKESGMELKDIIELAKAGVL